MSFVRPREFVSLDPTNVGRYNNTNCAYPIMFFFLHIFPISQKLDDKFESTRL